MSKYYLAQAVAIITLVISSNANSGFLDDLQKNIESEIQNEVNKVTGNKEKPSPQQQSQNPTNNSKTSSSEKSSWKNTQHADLLRLAMQINPEIFDYIYVYDYDLWFLDRNSKACSDASMENPRIAGGRDEFSRKKTKERLQKRTEQLISEAKGAKAVSRTFIYKEKGFLQPYDFKKKAFNFRTSQVTAPAVWLYNRNVQSSVKCPRGGSTLSNQAFQHNITLDRKNVSTLIPMSESKAEQYTKNHGKAVNLEFTLEVKNVTRKATELGGPVNFNVTVKQVKILSPDNGLVLASLSVSDMNKIDAQKIEASKPNYNLDTSWSRKKKSLDVTNQAIQGVRLGMSSSEAKKVLESKGYSASRLDKTGNWFDKNDDTGKRRVAMYWGSAQFNPASQKIYQLDYTRTYSNNVKFDAEAIKQQIRQQFGEPDKDLSYWDWPKTTVSEFQSATTSCQGSFKKAFKGLVTARKNGLVGKGGYTPQLILANCPGTSAKDINKMLEYMNVPRLVVNADGRTKSVKISSKWRYIYDTQRVQQAIGAVAKEKKKPTAAFEL